ncbi:MAG: hypothetical protein RLZZ301_1794 [Bacteroidota bacterium]
MRLFALIGLLLNGFLGSAQEAISRSKVAGVDSIYQLAIEAGYREQHQEAISYLTQVIALDPKTPEVYFDRGIQYEFLGMQTNAIADYTAAIKQNRHEADAWFLRGRMYVELHQYKLAFHDLNRANRLDPGNADAHCLCAEAAQHLNKTRQFQRKSAKCRL